MEQTAQQDDESIRGKWANLVLFIGFSALEVSVLASGSVTFDRGRDWVIVAGAFLFPILALVAAHSLASDPRLVGTGKKIAVLCKWLLAAPFVAVALGIGVVLLFSFFGWLATIPAWAAVIIVLLLLKR